MWLYTSRYFSLFCFVLVGGEIVSTFGNPEKVKLGKCKLIEEVMIGEDKVCILCACTTPAVLLVMH